MCTVRVLRQFGFDATLLRSGAVTVDNHAPANTATLFLRGAPSVIEQLVSKDTLPPSYREVMPACYPCVVNTLLPCSRISMKTMQPLQSCMALDLQSLILLSADEDTMVLC